MVKQKVKMKKEKIVNISNKESFIVFFGVDHCTWYVIKSIIKNLIERPTVMITPKKLKNDYLFFNNILFKISVDTKSTDVLFLKQQQQQNTYTDQQF